MNNRKQELAKTDRTSHFQKKKNSQFDLCRYLSQGLCLSFPRFFEQQV